MLRDGACSSSSNPAVAGLQKALLGCIEQGFFLILLYCYKNNIF